MRQSIVDFVGQVTKAQYCARYIAGRLDKGEPDLGTNHLGFQQIRAGI